MKSGSREKRRIETSTAEASSRIYREPFRREGESVEKGRVENTPTPEASEAERGAERLPTPDSRFFDVAVIGGGVIGCSVAYHAAKRGASVALFEGDRVASGASGAAAGMLNAQAESHAPGPMLDFMLESRRMHETFSKELLEKTGLDPEHVRAGTLRVAADEAFAERLADVYSWQKAQGLSAEWLGADEVRELESGVSPDALAGLYFPEEAQINSPRLVNALATARMGAEIFEGAPVSGFLTDGDRVVGVRSARGDFHAGSVVLAGGAASPSLAAKLGVEVPVFPVKGEILSVAANPAPICANVWDEACYLVPKRDGRIVVGATEEPGVHDRRPTLGGVAKLSSAAARLVPEVAGFPFAGHGAGFAPERRTGCRYSAVSKGGRTFFSPPDITGTACFSRQSRAKPSPPSRSGRTRAWTFRRSRTGEFGRRRSRDPYSRKPSRRNIRPREARSSERGVRMAGGLHP